ncbi:hypothetical protein AB0M45_15180 [Nocardia sp. NPDC051787]|uniref:hypothetical protein n=1 Tax=Nocardia sp. NPDC051787 TaxID=3155415 RepID=UPI0034454C3E
MLGEVLSSHGLLAQGRDLGIAVAAGLNGDNSPEPGRLVVTMQGDLADNFARRPLQVWNFGHVIDQSPRCAAAWSAGVRSGDSQVIDGMRACGDIAAHDEADNPSMAQIGSGLVLLLCGTILLLFGAYLAIKIIWAALDSIYHGFMAILGFAAGGFVYGPTQTFLVRNVVDSVVAAGRMAAYTIFVGVYVLFLGNLFAQAQGQVMVVLVLGAVVEIIAILQLRRLSAGLSRGDNWIANRFALAIQNGGSGSGSGAGGGQALGMGNAGASNSMSMLGVLAAASTINGSPITAWAAGGRLNPLSPFSWMEYVDKKTKAKGLATKDLRDASHGGLYDRVAAAEFARRGVHDSGFRHNSVDAAAFAAENVAHESGLVGAAMPHALKMAKIPWKRATKATKVEADIVRHADRESLASGHLARVVAAHKHFERYHLNSEWVSESLAGLKAHVARYRGDYGGGVRISPELQALGAEYLNNPTKQWIDELQQIANGDTSNIRSALAGHNWTMNETDPDRLRDWIANEHALRVQAATAWVAENPTDFERIRVLRSEIDRAAQTDQWQSGRNVTGANSLAQPDYVARPLSPIPDRLLRHYRNPGKP